MKDPHFRLSIFDEPFRRFLEQINSYMWEKELYARKWIICQSSLK